MAEQLTFLIDMGAEAPTGEAGAPRAAVQPAPVDPRQAGLLSGAQATRAELEKACEALDAGAVRAHHAELNRRFLGQRWADEAPRWAEGIEWLIGAPGQTLSLDDQLERALALLEPGTAKDHFGGIPPYLLLGIREAAARRAVSRLVDERGPGACLPSGEPAGWLLLQCGDVEGARDQLSKWIATAAGAAPVDPASPIDKRLARAWSWLAEALWRSEDVTAAVAAYCRACLLGAPVTEPDITCEAVLELFDTAANLELPPPLSDWIPVIADLQGMVRLGAEAIPAPTEASPARLLAAELAEYRLRGHRGSDRGARIEAKRRMARLAPPALRELLRML